MPRSCFLQPNGLPIDQEKRALETKVARRMRKLARQKSLYRMSSSGSNSTHQVDTRSLSLIGGARTGVRASTSTINRDPCSFCTPDNRRLRVLLSKELKNSDIGSIGRIVLPKRDAEEYLPFLSTKEGIQVVIKNAYSNQEWSLKYKYWSNCKSRMYVLENTVDFIKFNGMEVGDILTLCDDESNNLYFSIRKAERPVAGLSHEQHSTNHNQHSDHNCDYSYPYAPHMYQARNEEEASSLALLIEQLQYKEQLEYKTSLEIFSMESRNNIEEANNFVTFSTEPKSAPLNVTSIANCPQPPSAAMQHSSSHQSKTRLADDQQTNEHYPDLNMLSDFSTHNFLL